MLGHRFGLYQCETQRNAKIGNGKARQGRQDCAKSAKIFNNKHSNVNLFDPSWRTWRPSWRSWRALKRHVPMQGL